MIGWVKGLTRKEASMAYRTYQEALLASPHRARLASIDKSERRATYWEDRKLDLEVTQEAREARDSKARELIMLRTEPQSLRVLGII